MRHQKRAQPMTLRELQALELPVQGLQIALVHEPEAEFLERLALQGGKLGLIAEPHQILTQGSAGRPAKRHHLARESERSLALVSFLVQTHERTPVDPL